MIDLSHQVAIVSGGSRGIGAAASLALGTAGADVTIVCQQNLGRARRIVKELGRLGRTGHVVRCMVEASSVGKK